MKILKGLGLTSVVILLAGGIWAWDPLPANPDAKTLSASAEQYTVEIIRDNWGVPHIYGHTDADTSYGLAYAHAEDDYETIQEMVAATRGVLARYQGKAAAPTDYIVNLMGVWKTIDTRYTKDVSPEIKAISQAYAAGLNLYAAQHPDTTWKGLAPFTEQDIVAGFIFKTPFFYGLDATFLELFGDERQKTIALTPDGENHSWNVQDKPLFERGSNGIAVNGTRSGDGTTRLMINSHQPMRGPVAWYEAHLVSDEGMNMTGGLFPGTPMILHGFNDNLGWANTVSAQDLADVYVLDINPDNKDQYKLDGKWQDFEKTTAKLRIKLFGPFALKINRKVLRSAHGPVIESKHGVYAVRYAGMNEIGQLEQYYKLNHANNLAEFSQAMALNTLPSINYIYADKEGNVGFVHNAQYPNRKPGWDWQKYLPGDRSDLIWQGYLPYSAGPKLFNPSSGLVYNSNNQPFSATDGPDNLISDQFPPSMGLQTNQTNRSLRMMELTDGTSLIDRERLLAIKFDNKYSPKSRAFEVIVDILAADWSGDDTLAKAAQHLANWDGSTDTENRQAALGVLSTVKDLTAQFTHIPAPEPEEAFRWAVQYLIDNHGRIDPKWGDVNRLMHGDVNIAIDGAPDVLRAIYPSEIREDGLLFADAGDTWIALVEWDANGKLSADVIHQFGSATLDTNSPHYADQAEMFAQHRWRKALRDKEEIRQHAERTYRPSP
jgi:penicillin amidase/acyl-homoserine-lactone acylase